MRNIFGRRKKSKKSFKKICIIEKRCIFAVPLRKGAIKTEFFKKSSILKY